MRAKLPPLLLCLAVGIRSGSLHAQGEDAQGVQLPAPPPIDSEPLLEPVPPAPNVLPNWQQGITLLRARSTDLRIALDEVVRAEGAWRSALGAALPTVTGNANVTANLLRSCGPGCTTSIPDMLATSAGVSLVQPVFAPRAWHAIGSAKASIANTQLSLDEQKRQLAIALARAIVSVVTAERVSEVNRIGLRAALERLTLARRRSVLGAANALDVMRAEQDAASARATVVSADESLRQARETLGLALGSSDPWGVPRGINLDELPESARASCESVASLEDRTDLAAARGSQGLARRNVDNVRLQFAPSVNLVSNFAATSYPQGNLMHQSWTIAGVLTIPIFDGGVRYGALRDARAQADQASQRLEAIRRTSAVQLVQTQRAIEVAEQSRQVSEQARNLARETERLARVAFQAGTGTSLDLVESGRTLRVAEVQLAIQEFQLIQARLSAVLALSRCRW